VVDQDRPSGAGYTAADVARMQGANHKLVVSYLSIGEAEDYRSYWKPAWDSAKPAFLGPENPEWAGNYEVKYWKAGWQKIVFDMVDKIVDAGFNGLYLDIVDAYQYWQDRAPRSDASFYKDAMVDFVAAIRAHALAHLAEIGQSGRDFVLIGQNGLPLLADAGYRAAFDGVAREDAYFYYPNGNPGSFAETSDGRRARAQHWLTLAENHGVESFVVEYVPKSDMHRAVAALRTEIAALTHPLDAPIYLSSRRALDRMELAVDGQGRVWHWGGAHANTIEGTPWRDLMLGRGGDDRLSGGAARDRLDGGDGADRLHGGGANDRLIGGAGADRLHGGAGDDRLTGGTGDDRMHGGAGADMLDPGAGSDLAWGGGGADRFVFAPGDDRLLVEDFGRGADRLDLTGYALADFAALKGAMHGHNGNTVIHLGADTLVLAGVHPGEIAQSDVLL
jgi:cysteinyl-tRNA synthetase